MPVLYDNPGGCAPAEEWQGWLDWLRTQEPDIDGNLEGAIDCAESWLADLREEAEW